MSAAVKPVPDGYPAVSPYLCADGAAAINVHRQVSGATERMRIPAPEGRIRPRPASLLRPVRAPLERVDPRRAGSPEETGRRAAEMIGGSA